MSLEDSLLFGMLLFVCVVIVFVRLLISVYVYGCVVIVVLGD